MPTTVLNGNPRAELIRLYTFCRALIGVVILASALYCSGSYAQQEKTEQDQQSASKTTENIDKANQEIAELSTSIKDADGEERSAMQLHVFLTNEEMRIDIAKAIKDNETDTETLIELVDAQVEYTSNAMAFLDERIDQLTEQINLVDDEQKLKYIRDFQELQHYLDLMYEWQQTNLGWQTTLGVEDRQLRQELTDAATMRMRLLSANIEYYSDQQTIVKEQIDFSPESEQAALEVSQLVINQRLDIAIDSLRKMLLIGDALGLDTSDHKQLIFETTGNITYDLLNTEVVLSILGGWADDLFEWLRKNATQHLFQLFLFLLIVFIAVTLSRLTGRIVSKTVTSKNLNLSQLMQNFFVSVSSKIVLILGLLVGLSQLGVELTPILTGFGIAGVIIGFALQDTLGNFASGMMLLIYRPFDVGDIVHAGGVDGKVSHMSLVNTTIKTFDNQIIIIPNNKIWGDVIKNVTHERIRRVDMVFGIGYTDDLLKAESVLTDIVSAHPAVLKSPETVIRVHTLNTSSVDFIVRPWVKTDDYWDVYWDVTKEVKLRFDREGISIPFPQQDVHLHVSDSKAVTNLTNPSPIVQEQVTTHGQDGKGDEI